MSSVIEHTLVESLVCPAIVKSTRTCVEPTVMPRNLFLGDLGRWVIHHEE